MLVDVLEREEVLVVSVVAPVVLVEVVVMLIVWVESEVGSAVLLQ